MTDSYSTSRLMLPRADLTAPQIVMSAKQGRKPDAGTAMKAAQLNKVLADTSKEVKFRQRNLKRAFGPSTPVCPRGDLTQIRFEVLQTDLAGTLAESMSTILSDRGIGKARAGLF